MSWAGVLLLTAVAAVLVVRPRFEWSHWDSAALLASGAFGSWLALSLLWSSSRAQTVLEIERMLVFVAGLALVLLVTRRGVVDRVLAETVLAIAVVCGYGLATRLFPDHIGVFDPIAVYRLSEPVGYWNTMGLVAGMGAILAFGFASRARYRRACAGGGVARSVRRDRLLHLRPGRAADARSGPRAEPPPRPQAAPGSADAGRRRSIPGRHGLERVGARGLDTPTRSSGRPRTTATASSSFCSRSPARRRSRPSCWSGPSGGCSPAATCDGPGEVLVAAPLAALLAVFAVYGGPVGIVDRAIESFQGPPPRVVDLSDRLRSFSGNGRDQLWSVAWGEFTERPVIGAGAGTYERAWLLERPADLPVRDAHSLYLETLSELGLVGLVALLAMLGVPAAAALRSRHTPLVPAAFGASAAHTSSTPAPTGTGSWPASRSRRSSAARRSW